MKTAWFVTGSQKSYDSDNITDIEFLDYIVDVPYRVNCSNILGRILDTATACIMDGIMESNSSKDISEEHIAKLLDRYWKTVEFTKMDRQGYLLIVAGIVSLLESIEHNSNCYDGKKSRNIYSENRKRLMENENENGSTEECWYCSSKGIDLRKIPIKEYHEFSKHLMGVFERKKRGSGGCFADDKSLFVERCRRIEEERENLRWRKRNFSLPTQNKAYGSLWCQGCLVCKDIDPNKFSNLLACCPRNETDEKTQQLESHDYEHIMETWEVHFLKHLRNRSRRSEPDQASSLHFLGLQRWNSTSPAQGRSVGGGYLLYQRDAQGGIKWGIAIDPGFDFVRNLFHVGFSLSDIDLVLLSHAHIDHVRDFESMVNLYLELDKRTKDRRRVHVIMTLGIYRRLAHVIESPGLRKYIEPYIVDVDKEIKDTYYKDTEFKFTIDHDGNSSKKFKAIVGNYDQECAINVRPTIAYHNDFSEYSDSFGFIVRIMSDGVRYTFGYTGDTSWCCNVMSQYNGCNAMLCHIGSLIDREENTKFDKYKDPYECYKLIREKNHPYLMGMLRFLSDIKNFSRKDKPLVLLSEFGEELRGRIRLDLVDRIHNAYGLDVLPVDVGLDVRLCTAETESYESREGNSKAEVECVVCEKFVKIERVDYETYGLDEALFCVCRTCRKSTPGNVLQHRLRNLHEIGRSLQPSPANN